MASAASNHSTLIQQLLARQLEELRQCRDGSVADYIPELAKADPEDFGIVLATADGRLYAVGDTGKPFTIQSISKPFMYGLALRLLSPSHMTRKVGVEPSGDAFNAISLDPRTGIPRNPMINAGAIATAAQVWQHDPLRAEAITLEFFSALAGRPLDLDQAVYASERDTGHRNRAISHLLRNAAVIEEQPEAGLDLYFRQCSIRVTCRDLAVMAATLACQGRNPLTGATPLDPLLTTRLLAVMGSCGMYDYAGQWLYDVGMPAKSGVGGGVLAVVPGRLGIAVYSPRLDAFGNSVRGIAACRQLSESLELHLFDQSPLQQSPVRSSYRGTDRRSRRWRSDPETTRLDPLRERITVLHAQGVLDFAALESVLSQIEQACGDAEVIVLDLGQVSDLAPAGLALLEGQAELLRRSGRSLLLCRCDHLELPSGLKAPGLSHASLDLALEAAEDLLLNARTHGDIAIGAERGTATPLPAAGAEAQRSGPSGELPSLEQLSLLATLDPDRRRSITARLSLRRYTAGTVVMSREQESDQLFIVASGRFSIFLPIRRPGSRPRLARVSTFAEGMVFGDATFFSGEQRMADVVADTEGCCWLLHRDDFARLQQEDPAAAIALLTLLAVDLGRKLSLCAQQLAVLEDL
ncbi:MAG: glutaminase A [Synechococcaceae cyanobacterium]|nr:glutaminase A [Synechococcaceae cyanobacterium]